MERIDPNFAAADAALQARLEREVEHGRYLVEHGAGDVWNWESPAGRVRWSRRVRMLSSHLRPDMKVLELGCGTAYFTRELAQTGATITAIDISPELLEEARRSCPAGNVTFETQNASALNYRDETFDSVVGSSVLHHLELAPAVNEIHRVLRPRGTIYFTEPNMMNPQIAMQKNIPWIKRRLGDSPDETAFFRWPLERLLKRAGFREVRIEPFDFLHPKIPEGWIATIENLGLRLEKMPVLREIAGSLYIHAVK